MSSTLLTFVAAIVLIAHGIGHALGLMPIFGIRLSANHSTESWALTGPLGDTAARVIAVGLWLFATVGFVCAGLGLLGWIVAQEWWRPLAIGASIASLVGLALYLNAFPFTFPNKIGVIAVDVAVLVSLLWLHWPSLP